MCCVRDNTHVVSTSLCYRSVPFIFPVGCPSFRPCPLQQRHDIVAECRGAHEQLRRVRLVAGRVPPVHLHTHPRAHHAAVRESGPGGLSSATVRLRAARDYHGRQALPYAAHVHPAVLQHGHPHRRADGRRARYVAARAVGGYIMLFAYALVRGMSPPGLCAGIYIYIYIFVVCRAAADVLYSCAPSHAISLHI